MLRRFHGTTAMEGLGSRVIRFHQMFFPLLPTSKPAAQDDGLVSDDGGVSTSQADAISSTQETNLTDDSPDFGDIMP